MIRSTNTHEQPSHAGWVRRPGHQWTKVVEGTESACWRHLLKAGDGSVGVRDVYVAAAGLDPNAGRRPGKMARLERRGGMKRLLFPETDADGA